MVRERLTFSTSRIGFPALLWITNVRDDAVLNTYPEMACECGEPLMSLGSVAVRADQAQNSLHGHPQGSLVPLMKSCS